MVRHLALRLGLMDNPGGRKIHIIAVPRLGGVSLCLSMCLSLFVSSHLGTVTGLDISEAWPSPEVLLGMGLAFLVGLYDDLRPTPAWCKFSVQFVAAGIVIYSGVRIPLVSIIGFGSVDPGMLAIPLTFLWIVGITNAFNLIDGLDGLAAGLGFIAAVTSTIIFCLGGGFSADALLLVILAGVLAGFLRYNFHPASIFLGDSGSQVIGYVLAVTSVVGSQKSATALPLIIPVLIFGLPICDTVLSRSCPSSSHLNGLKPSGRRSHALLSGNRALGPSCQCSHRRISERQRDSVDGHCGWVSRDP